jgi:hypothetical protein
MNQPYDNPTMMNNPTNPNAAQLFQMLQYIQASGHMGNFLQSMTNNNAAFNKSNYDRSGGYKK